MKKKNNTIIFFLLIFSFSLKAQSSLSKKINVLLEDSLFNSSIAAIDIYDLSAKESLFEKNTKTLLRPASNMKILTTTTGLFFLGPDYNFETRLLYDGKIKHSVLYGNLYISGGGDPDFTVSDLDSLIFQLKESGIKEIRGNIIADLSFTDSLFWGKGWMWDDDPSTDAPYLSALNINKNSVIVTLEPGKIGKKAIVKTIPKTRFFKIINRSTTVDSTTQHEIQIKRDWIRRNNNIIVSGNISVNHPMETAEMNVYNPALYFITLFKEKLKENNIKQTGKLKISDVPSPAINFCTFKRPFKNVIMGLNKNSDNLSAEMTLRALAVTYFGRPAKADSGIKMIDSLIGLAGFNCTSYRIVDGSGVSHYNLVSAELLLGVLRYIYFTRNDLFNILYNSFPVAGVDGTLRNRMKMSPAEGNVHAKTGTISGVSCLSGYVKSKNNHLLAFSIMIQNYVGSSSKAVKLQDEICRIMAESE